MECQNLGWNLAHLGLKHQEAPHRLLRGLVDDGEEERAPLKASSGLGWILASPAKLFPA